MERRSWPWRRKPADKASHVSPSLNVSECGTIQPSITLFDLSSGTHDSITMLAPDQDASQSTDNTQVMETILQWQQAEKKVTILTEKLAAALSDIAEKNEIVKQQSKVAEDAVSAWQRAESEALDFKQQLAVARQENIVAEGRATRMDDALKECLKQIQQLREGQEERVQETVTKRNKELEKMRMEFEAKQAELAGRLLEFGAENSAMSKSLQERARTILEVNEAKAKAESEVKVLQVRLESSEKEISSLNYEIHVLNKELEIRNEEREFNKRSAASAHRQHLENVKKIAKHESECQRLRALLRKKLPGPVMGRMKMEADSFGSGREAWEGRRRRSASKGVTMLLDSWQERSQANMNKEVEMLTDRLLTMEEEATLLKEALAKRNSELLVSRQLCDRTIGKLTVDEQLEHGQIVAKVPIDMQIEEQMHHTQNTTNLAISDPLLQSDVLSTTGPSLASRSEDDNAHDDEASCAESWASALIAELAHFKKVKSAVDSRKLVDSYNLEAEDGIDEFELPALPLNHLNNAKELTMQGPGLASRIQTSSQMCKNALNQLSLVEENLTSLKDGIAENQALFQHIQASFSSIDGARQQISHLNNVLAEVRMMPPLDASGMKDQGVMLGSCEGENVCSTILEGNDLNESRSLTNVHGGHMLLTNPRTMSSVCSILYKIVQLIETLVQQMDVVSCIEENPSDKEGSNLSSKSSLEKQMQSLICMKNKLSKDKLDIMEYLVRLAVVLSCMCGLDIAELESLLTNLSSSNTDGKKVEELVVSIASNLKAASGLQQEEGILTDTYNQNCNFQQEANTETLGANRLSIESLTLVANLQRDLGMTKEDKDAVELKLHAAKEEIQGMQSKLAETELFVSALEQKLASAEQSRGQAERDLGDKTALNAELATQLEDTKLQIKQLSEKVASLTAELEHEQRQCKETVIRCKNFEQQLEELKNGSSQPKALLSSCRSVNEYDTRTRKEQDMVTAKEKLAECQHTILVLGRQLDALTVCDSMDTSFTSSVHSSLCDHKILPAVASVEPGSAGLENVQLYRNPFEVDRQNAHSDLQWSRSNMQSLEQDSFNRGYASGSLDTEFYMPSNHNKAQRHPHCPATSYYNRHCIHPGFYIGNGIHSPIQECIERSSFVISPPDTGNSSPAISPASFLQYQEKRASGNAAVQINLAKSMNKVASNSPSLEKRVKPGRLSRLFSWN